MDSPQPHYLILTTGTAGDIHPFMQIALSLQAMGRRVTFISNSVHAKRVNGSGLTFVGYGSEAQYLHIIQNPNIWHPRHCISTLFEGCRQQLVELDAVIRAALATGPTVIIAHPLTVPSAAIAREQGLVANIIAMHLAPSSLRTCHNPLRIGEFTLPKWFPMRWRKACWRLVDKELIDPVVLAEINAARITLGLPCIHTSFLDHIEQAPNLTVTLFPTWFGPTMPDWPQPLINGSFQLYDPAPRAHFSHELCAFLATGEQPIVFTPGTGNLHAAQFFASAVAATQQLGQRAILLTSERSQLPAELPAAVLWQPYVCLADLLPKAKALVHHGGIGTTAEAFRAATPQLLTPFAWDQFDNAARVKELGAGLVLRATRISTRRLTNTLRALITTPAIQAHCQQIAQQFAAPVDPNALCQQIEAKLISGLNTVN